MGNPFGGGVASASASKQAAHCKRRVPNCFTNAIGTYAAISRDKSPMSNRI
jgi:hypothetical protein